jgi:hypothetical protein
LTNEAKILELLKNAGNSLCDDCIEDKSGMVRRQIVNQICNILAKRGSIQRSLGVCENCQKRKIVNSIASGRDIPVGQQKERPSETTRARSADAPWYWEGNLQKRLASWLESQGNRIQSVADTLARSRGVDIIAEDANGKALWITVKGFPGTGRHVQARHYFAEAIFDLIIYGRQSNTIQLAIGLPAGFPTYKNLARKVEWIRKETLPFDIYWISETGEIHKE